MESIHDYPKALEGIKRRIGDSDSISQKNKTLITRFTEDCFAHSIGLACIIRYLYALRDLATWLKKDFDICTSGDLKKIVAQIEQMKYSPRTKCEYRCTLKKFYKWLKNKDHPKEVSWLKTNFKKNNDKLPSEILKEEDILKMVNATKNPRDRAMIIGLYESGCRIGEFLKMKIREILFEKPGCIFTVQGKTGGRRVRVISAEPYILEWLNKHPAKDNGDSYVWLRNNSTEILEYAAFCKAMRVAAKRAGIKKKVNPHNFRHARATYLASKFTEQQLKVFFGWTRSSDMAAVYVHLSGKEVDDALLTTYGLGEQKKEITRLKPTVCPICKSQNEVTNKFCSLCGTILEEKARDSIIAKETETQEATNIMNTLFKDKEFLEFLSKKLKGGLLQT